MMAAIKVVAGVALTSLSLSVILGAALPRHTNARNLSLFVAIPNAVAWAVVYGVWGWQHRMDWEHVKNYPLIIHVIFMAFSALGYAGVGFAIATGVFALIDRIRRRAS